MKVKKLLTAVALALNPSWELRWGVCLRSAGMVVVLLACRGEQKRVLFSARGRRKPWILSVATPVSIDTGVMPLILLNEPLGEDTIERWLNEHQGELIPAGFQSEQIQSECCVVDETVFAASLAHAAVDAFEQRAASAGLTCGSLSVGLWHVARLYWPSYQQPFILWKVTDEGSVLGFVDNGYLRAVVSWWMDATDLQSIDSQNLQELATIFSSLGGQHCSTIVMMNDGEPPDISALSIPGYRFAAQPQIEGVLGPLHEPYALAAAEPCNLDFARGERGLGSRGSGSSREGMLKFIRNALVLIGVVWGLLGVGLVGSRLVQSSLDSRLAPLRSRIAVVKQAEVERDSVQALFSARNRFGNRESALTELLNQLQPAFPTGMWVEQIVVQESELCCYRIELIAVSFSSALVADFLKRLETIAGMRDVRMLYSEQVSEHRLAKDKPVLRISVSGLWQNGALAHAR